MPRPLKGFQFIAPTMSIHRGRREQSEWAETTGRDLSVDPRTQSRWSPQRRAAVLVRQAADAARTLNVIAQMPGEQACALPHVSRYVVNGIAATFTDLHDAGVATNALPAGNVRSSLRDRIFAVERAGRTAAEHAVNTLMRCAATPPNPYDD